MRIRRFFAALMAQGRLACLGGVLLLGACSGGVASAPSGGAGNGGAAPIGGGGAAGTGDIGGTTAGSGGGGAGGFADGGGRSGGTGGSGAGGAGGRAGAGGAATGGRGGGGGVGATAGSAGGGGGGADVCSSPPPPGCCTIPGDCFGNSMCTGSQCRWSPTGSSGPAFGRCVPAIVNEGPGPCYEDNNCPGPAFKCVGARLCPCGATCPYSDLPGSCQYK